MWNNMWYLLLIASVCYGLPPPPQPPATALQHQQYQQQSPPPPLLQTPSTLLSTMQIHNQILTDQIARLSAEPSTFGTQEILDDLLQRQHELQLQIATFANEPQTESVYMPQNEEENLTLVMQQLYELKKRMVQLTAEHFPQMDVEDDVQQQQHKHLMADRKNVPNSFGQSEPIFKAHTDMLDEFINRLKVHLEQKHTTEEQEQEDKEKEEANIRLMERNKQFLHDFEQLEHKLNTLHIQIAALQTRLDTLDENTSDNRKNRTLEEINFDLIMGQLDELKMKTAQLSKNDKNNEKSLPTIYYNNNNNNKNWFDAIFNRHKQRTDNNNNLQLPEFSAIELSQQQQQQMQLPQNPNRPVFGIIKRVMNFMRRNGQTKQQLQTQNNYHLAPFRFFNNNNNTENTAAVPYAPAMLGSPANHTIVVNAEDLLPELVRQRQYLDELIKRIEFMEQNLHKT